jgi:DNA-binding response OmpR family regulator
MKSPNEAAMTEEIHASSLPLVLAVDDDPLMNRLYPSLLKETARVATATNTYDAEEKMRELQPNLVILDDIMPNCPSGIRLLEKVKKDEALKDIPVIMVTASDKEEEILRGLQLGAAAYLTKPVKTEALLQAVQTELGRKRKKILIVMKDKKLGDLLEEMFTRLKCEVARLDAEEALDAKQSPPQLILLGRCSTQERASAALRRMRNRPGFSSTPVIVLDDEGAGEDSAGPSLTLPTSSSPRDIAMHAARLMQKKA